MLEGYLFHTKQLNYVRAAMAEVPDYLPDAKTVAQVDVIIGAREKPRKDYLAKHTALTVARGSVHEAHDLGHKAAVSVYGFMKSVYRNLPATLEAIERVPVDDRTPDDTLTRLGKLSEVWSTLPNMPGNAKPFVAGKIDQEALDELHDDLDAKLKTFSRCDQEFQTVAGALNELDAEHADFISGALVQGRKQFEPGTAARRVVDAIPTPSAPASPAAPHEPAAQASTVASTNAAAPAAVVPAPSPSSNTTTVSFDTPAAANQ